jgi:hypothetical protein
MKIVFGIDQSLKNTGVTVNVNNGEELFVHNIYTEKLPTNSHKRTVIRKQLSEIVESTIDEYGEVDYICLIERIRLRSQGFLNIDYIKAIGALNSIIVDVMVDYGIETFSVDTRAWKSAIVGTSKPRENAFGLPSEKFPTILWNIQHGRKKYIINYDVGRKKNGVIEKNGKRYTYDDDRSDSIAISFYGFLPKGKQKLETER